MAKQSRVPKFGNWDSEENVPYTAYFDKARKGRTGAKIINPNDPEENPELFYDNSSSTTKAEAVEPVRPRSTHQRRQSKELDGDSTGRSYGESNYKRPGARSENSVERSPLHSHGTPGRSRPRSSAHGNETPDRSATVPKFGAWDLNNPASADGYTHIFNQVREERQSVAGRIPGTPPRYTTPKQDSDDNAKVCCFPWAKK